MSFRALDQCKNSFSEPETSVWNQKSLMWFFGKILKYAGNVSNASIDMPFWQCNAVDHLVSMERTVCDYGHCDSSAALSHSKVLVFLLQFIQTKQMRNKTARLWVLDVLVVKPLDKVKLLCPIFKLSWVLFSCLLDWHVKSGTTLHI